MKQNESGNILFIILIAIALLAALAGAISSSGTQQSDVIERQTMSDQVSRTLSQVSLLSSALLQMIINGENETTLYSDLSTLKPGDVEFETSPHNLKIYHPYGGGVKYMEASIVNTADAATKNFSINADSIIEGVGATNAIIGDILFTAIVSSKEYCEAFNKQITGSTTIPSLAFTQFNTLFITGTTTNVDNVACVACINKPVICVDNTAGNAWGFYASLLPG